MLSGSGSVVDGEADEGAVVGSEDVVLAEYRG
jgi:hypothetical protein